jgi:iron(III) transport system substrate-binding protein
MQPCLNLTPAMGLVKTSYLGIANMSQHPNAAKLFIKFALSQEGYDPWNELGIYSAQPSVELPEGAIPLEEMMSKSWLMNPIYGWENAAKVRDFWALNYLAP